LSINATLVDTQLRPVGIIHSTLDKLEDCPRQENENAPGATLEIFSSFLEGIADVKPGDQLIVLTWLHKADRTTLKTKPRNNPTSPLCGVFSTRSPDRPNPIGIHVVKVLAVQNGNKLYISNLEVLNQTPLVDIKPIF
jgi:tRNA-Thr(GGU) m(6)t(6)A37 methyltransferase TsaA